MLTHKMHRILLFVDRTIRETGVAPSYREISQGVGMKSIGNVQGALISLEQRGFIERLPNRNRAIRVLRLPPSTAAEPSRPVPLRDRVSDLEAETLAIAKEHGLDAQAKIHLKKAATALEKAAGRLSPAQAKKPPC